MRRIEEFWIEFNPPAEPEEKTSWLTNLSFDIIDFHHLSGLKYLQEDMPNLKRKRDYIFNEIISQKIRKNFVNFLLFHAQFH